MLALSPDALCKGIIVSHPYCPHAVENGRPNFGVQWNHDERFTLATQGGLCQCPADSLLGIGWAVKGTKPVGLRDREGSRATSISEEVSWRLRLQGSSSVFGA